MKPPFRRPRLSQPVYQETGPRATPLVCVRVMQVGVVGVGVVDRGVLVPVGVWSLAVHA